MTFWTKEEEVEYRHGHLRGTSRESFLINLLQTARDADATERAWKGEAYESQKTSNERYWTHVEEAEAFFGHLRGTTEEYVLIGHLEAAIKRDESEAGPGINLP